MKYKLTASISEEFNNISRLIEQPNYNIDKIRSDLKLLHLMVNEQENEYVLNLENLNDLQARLNDIYISKAWRLVVLIRKIAVGVRKIPISLLKILRVLKESPIQEEDFYQTLNLTLKNQGEKNPAEIWHAQMEAFNTLIKSKNKGSKF